MRKYLLIFENGEFIVQDGEPKNLTEELVLVRFVLETHGKKEYSELEIYTLSDELVDSCFVCNKGENVAVQTQFGIENERKFIALSILNNDHEDFEISAISFEKAKDNLFDGGVLYQLAPVAALNMSYVFVTKQGKVLVFDGGREFDEPRLTAFIQTLGGVVEHWFITHYHDDHIRALMEIFKKQSLGVKNIYFHFPPVELLSDRGDSNNSLVSEFTGLIPHSVTRHTAKKGLTVCVDEATITVLNDACFEKGDNFVNDSSVCFKLSVNKTNVLFTGDLGIKGDDYLLEDDFVAQIKDCNVVQMAHHGQSGVSKKFYEATGVEICLYPTAKWLWNNDKGDGKNSCTWKTLKTREWMREMKVIKSYPALEEVVRIK